MSPIRRTGTVLRARFFDIASVLLFFMLASLALHAAYRLEIFRLAQRIYPGLRELTFGGYLAAGYGPDCAAVLLGTLMLACVVLPLGNRVRAAYIVAVAFLLVQGTFLFMAADFFRSYQTSFQMNFFGDENFTDPRGFFLSFFAEISGAFYLKLATAPCIIGGIALAMYRQNRIAHYLAFDRSGSRASRWRSFVVVSAPLLLAFLVLGAVCGVSRREGDKLRREIAMNPIYNVFFTRMDETAVQARPAPRRGDGAFRFGFDTSSLEAGTSYDRSGAIPRGRRYNIILYFFESMSARYQPLAINGHEVTPSWNRLARNSLNLTRHYANYPLSANAMLSVFTSAYDWNGKKLVIQTASAIRLRTIANMLKERGYRTMLVHTGMLEYAGQKRFLKDRGFDRIADYRDIKRPPYTEWVGWGLDERALIRPCEEFIAEDPDRPWFIAVFPVSPHHPYPVPDESFRITGGTPVTGSRQKVWLSYLDSLHYSDLAMGELVDRLESRGFMENTLLFLFADHGEAFYQHPMNYNHPFYLYEENVHVPCLIYNRKLFDEPAYFRGVTRHIDFLPTILDLVGGKALPEQEGISFLAPHREQFALLHTSWKDDYLGVRDGRWKYIRRTQDGFEELYDLDTDLQERTNLAQREPAVAKRYRDVVLRAREYKDEYYRRVLARRPVRDKREDK